MRDTALGALVLQANARYVQLYEERVDDMLAQYRDSWQPIVDALLSTDKLPPPGAAKYAKKERAQVKAKFEHFNRDMEAVQAQRAYIIPDVKLRRRVCAATQAYVSPAYATFYAQYAHTPFTENYAKYLKLTPDALSELIDRLFDGGEATSLRGTGSSAAAASGARSKGGARKFGRAFKK